MKQILMAMLIASVALVSGCGDSGSMDSAIGAAKRGDADAFRPTLAKLKGRSDAEIGRLMHALLLEYDIKKVAGESLDARLARLKKAQDGKLAILGMVMSSRTTVDRARAVQIAASQNALVVMRALAAKTAGRSSQSSKAVHQFAESAVGKLKFTKDYSDGGHYEGDSRNGMANGKGVMTWGSNTERAGDRYEGDFVNGERTGKGVYTWAEGMRYEGDFVDGAMTGKGVFTLDSH